jgi:phage terminase large subunit
MLGVALGRKLDKSTTRELLSREFKQQCDFIEDPAKLKALFCTRRAAKSYTGGLYMVKECLENPRVNCAFIGLTRMSAKAIVWKDILKTINRVNNLQCKFNETELTVTFPNGSIIYINGIDTNETEMDKLLGRKYRLVVVDEASLYSVNVKHLVYDLLKPAMADERGTICLVGTSSNITKGLFYDITTGAEPGWSVHKWSALDNPFVASNWQLELDDITNQRPLYKLTPQYRQWYLNEWVVDEDKLVYKYGVHRNLYSSPPSFHRGQWHYVLGVDLGYEDDTAFVMTAFHEHDKSLYILETHKRSHMDITDVANRIKAYQAKYSVFTVIMDGANKQAVQEIVRRHDIGIRAADKTGKSDFIEIMNAELIQGHIKVHESLRDLVEEWQSLVWVTEGDKIKLPRKENPNLPNHLCDAALYAWRYCYSYLATPQPKEINMKEHWVEHTGKLMEESLQRQIDRQTADDSQQLQMDMMEADPFQENPLSAYLNTRRRK